jgi:hypothetical protein
LALIHVGILSSRLALRARPFNYYGMHVFLKSDQTQYCHYIEIKPRIEIKRRL